MANELVFSGGKWVLQATSGITWIDIEDLGVGFTASDPDGRLTSYSYNSSTKVHTFNLATLPNIGSAYNDYSISTTLGTFKPPRWGKTLRDENGVALTSDDEFTMLIRQESFVTGSMISWSTVVGFSRDISSTNRATVAFCGTGIGMSGIAAPTSTAVFAGSNTNQVSLTSGSDSLGQSVVCGAGRNKFVGSQVSIMSAGNATATARNGQLTVSAATPLYLEVICPTQGSVLSTTGGAFSMTMKYAIARS